METPDLNATVVARKDPNERLVVLRVRPDAAPVPEFEPGQFIQLGLPLEQADASGSRRVQVVTRAYSIASSPDEKDAFELFLALVDDGRLTTAMWPIAVGGRCFVDPRPLGSFTLAGVPHEADLVLVATGTGISPYVSMVRTYARGAARHASSRWRRCALIHGVRRAVDLGYEDEIRARTRTDPSLCYVPVVSREPEQSAWSGLRGRVQAVLDGERCREVTGVALDPERCHVFLCGNPEMIRSVRSMLATRGFVSGPAGRRRNLHFERYW